MSTPSSAARGVNAQLSCTNCRHRKIKCDKTQPCAACVRSKIDCSFPTERLPRGRQRGSRNRNAELLKRLDQLEGIVEKLGGEANAEKQQKPDAGVEAARAFLRTPPGGSQSPQPAEGPNCNLRPIVKADGSRYLSGDFWTSLSNEVDGLRQLLDEVSDDEGDSADTSPSRSHKGSRPFETPFVFGDGGELKNLRWLHPSYAHAAALVDVYFTRVDGLFKILHRPTEKPSMLAAAANLDSIPQRNGQEALMFAAYFAAITSLSNDECVELFGRDKESLLAQYKYGAEIALSNADFLNSMELRTLQAFVLYLLCLRNHNESRSAWTLISLAVRIAHALDLHRDGPTLSFSPFDTEMRRRLWWALIVLDVRACEDRGSPPLISENTFTTHMPLNINDEDISPESTEAPKEHIGCTEMTFCLISHEASVLAPWLSFRPLADGAHGGEPMSRKELEELIKQFSDRLETKYLTHCDVSVPIFWACATIAQIVCRDIFLHVQYPLQLRQYLPRSRATKESILTAAVESLELSDAVENHPVGHIWGWFAAMYVQWHALAVALAELCVQTSGPLVDRGWVIVDTLFEKYSERVADSKKGLLWRPIKKLYAKAKSARLQNSSLASATSSAQAPTQPTNTDTTMTNPPPLHTAAALATHLPPDFPFLSPDVNAHIQTAPHDISLTGPLHNLGTDPTFDLPLPVPSSQDIDPGGLPTAAINGMSLDPDPFGDQTSWNDWDEYLQGTFSASGLGQEGGFGWAGSFGP
ncbi:hypothetical protein H2201_003073 [Coniosporium apollinis]|uniref:Zn(2)-C6 fungal-type domain-containing protein n=1 Tax=Coniosporium apollinis TaxID=61459 RepID=A0ABQ9NX35_9PEZI|nr:hypothetical protein H2201_003073 [Coniosporium apollinis]